MARFTNTLKTIGLENNRQKRNKIKGIAQEILIKEVVGGQERNDVSASKIIKKALCRYGDSKYFFCKHEVKMFNGITKKKIVYHKYEGIPEYRLRKDFKDIKGNSDYFFLSCKFYKRGKWEHLGKVFKFETLLHKLKKSYKIKSGREEMEKTPCSIDYFSDLRTDYIFYNGRNLKVFESKNKEDTHLSNSDIGKSMKYPLLFKAIGAQYDNFQIIYNGSIIKNSTDILDYYRKRYNLNIKPPKLITAYLREKTDINGIKIKDLPVKDNYELKRSKSPLQYYIDLTPLEEHTGQKNS